jgi:septal ring factor EnvC (AmiA/AmiB activator)
MTKTIFTLATAAALYALPALAQPAAAPGGAPAQPTDAQISQYLKTQSDTNGQLSKLYNDLQNTESALATRVFEAAQLRDQIKKLTDENKKLSSERDALKADNARLKSVGSVPHKP